jgi:hypothetical protein
MTPCSLVEIDRRFRGVHCLHHQGDETHRPDDGFSPTVFCLQNSIQINDHDYDFDTESSLKSYYLLVKMRWHFWIRRLIVVYSITSLRLCYRPAEPIEHLHTRLL